MTCDIDFCCCIELRILRVFRAREIIGVESENISESEILILTNT